MPGPAFKNILDFSFYPSYFYFLKRSAYKDVYLVLLNGPAVDQEFAGELVARVPSLGPTKKWERRASPQGCPVCHTCPSRSLHPYDRNTYRSISL